ncbi:sarcosine oxidase subunit delta [Phormidesmis priestleyi]|uniref:sarcosine oxidase subunit delta n=1 Tax=Phormidesmis priestleyi TaxID=268141 RepID=UPI00083AB3EA|nr:sarcosine oxidase subunit delta [Phormidesmis priestleyi]
MKLMTCPVNGARSISEFVCAGEVRPIPDPNTTNDLAWGAFVFHCNGAAGIKQEWWCHTPSDTWFIAERNTQTDEILRTYLWGEVA